jgi:hypothetical protein
MTKQAAQAIIEEAERDPRLAAQLNTKYVRQGRVGRGYHVRVALRASTPRERFLIVHDLRQWSDIKRAWEGL